MSERSLIIRTQLLDATEEEMIPGMNAHRANMNVLRLADVMRAQYEVARCTEHPEQVPVIVLRALPDGTMEVDRSALCCAEFARQLS